MTEIDWSKAPEGATHALTTGSMWSGSKDHVDKIEFAFEHDGTFFCSPLRGDDSSFSMGSSSWVIASYRPECVETAGWNGTGLPPVGTVCEYLFCEGAEWRKGTVVAHYEGRAVVCDLEDDAAERVQERNLRPVRTAEQIAAAEREKAIIEMARAIMPGQVCAGPEDMKRAERLYQAGYRKQEQPQ